MPQSFYLNWARVQFSELILKGIEKIDEEQSVLSFWIILLLYVIHHRCPSPLLLPNKERLLNTEKEARYSSKFGQGRTMAGYRWCLSKFWQSLSWVLLLSLFQLSCNHCYVYQILNKTFLWLAQLTITVKDYWRPKLQLWNLGLVVHKPFAPAPLDEKETYSRPAIYLDFIWIIQISYLKVSEI